MTNQVPGTNEDKRVAIELRRSDAEVRTMEVTIRKIEAERMGMLPAEAQRWEMLQRRANALADSDIVPAAYRGKPSNCLIALEIADRLGASPLMIMQNMDVIHGNIGFRAKFLVALVNKSKAYTRLLYVWHGEQKDGDAWGCHVEAKDRETGQLLEGPIVSIATARTEGWLSKNDKWKSIPQLMLMYRSAAWWARVHAPETGLGLLTAEELEDVAPLAIPMEISGGNTSDLADELRKSRSAKEVVHDFDPETGEIIEPKPAAPAPSAPAAAAAAAPPEPKADAPPGELSAEEKAEIAAAEAEGEKKTARKR